MSRYKKKAVNRYLTTAFILSLFTLHFSLFTFVMLRDILLFDFKRFRIGLYLVLEIKELP